MAAFYFYSSVYILFTLVVHVCYAVNDYKDGFAKFTSITGLCTLLIQASIMLSTHWV